MTKDEIIIHCSDSPEGRNDTVNDIQRWHKSRGWKAIGYNYVIHLDGSIHKGRDLDGDGNVNEETGAHALGHNKRSIGICYIGGADSITRKPKDTRTPEQKEAMKELVLKLKRELGITKVLGHNEVSAKACPSFDVKQWLINECI